MCRDCSYDSLHKYHTIFVVITWRHHNANIILDASLIFNFHSANRICTTMYKLNLGLFVIIRCEHRLELARLTLSGTYVQVDISYREPLRVNDVTILIGGWSKQTKSVMVYHQSLQFYKTIPAVGLNNGQGVPDLVLE